MKQYAQISEDGYVIATTFSTLPQAGMVEITESIDNPPSPWHQFHLDTHDWVENKPIEQYDLDARTERNRLLLESDWTQLPDVPLATKEAWATYRQALRDITEQPGYPLLINWPVQP